MVIRRWPVGLWPIWGIVLAMAITVFLLVVQSATVSASSESTTPLDCLKCHQQPLTFHDQLGSGNKACWACHDTTDMTSLHLVDGTLLPNLMANPLCAQCHQTRYQAWQEGTHGTPGTVARGQCTDCHNPHRPQMEFIDITLPHPVPAPAAPQIPFDTIMVVAVSLVFVIGLGVVWARQGEGS